MSTGRDGVSRMSKAVCRTEGEWDREGGVGQGEGVGTDKGINQINILFMSVHIEVILDKNKTNQKTTTYYTNFPTGL